MKSQILTINEARKYADSSMCHAVACMAHAFNACNNPELTYQYSKATQERFLEIAIELKGMINNDGIEMLTLKHAKSDSRFQKFLTDLNSVGMGNHD